ncbi:MAG: hypothetical protein G3H99_06950 [Ferrovum sp.]|nr:hypothetical protein [Ferrovum sp.]NDU87581.1 hypothetical protein [Ferrovum sp.]
MTLHEIELARVDTDELKKFCNAPWRYHETGVKAQAQLACRTWPMLEEISSSWQQSS